MFNKDILQIVYHKIAHSLKKYDVARACSEGVATEIAQNINSIRRFLWLHSNLRYGFKDIKVVGVPNYLRFDKILCISKNSEKAFVEVTRTELELNLKDQTHVLYNPVNE